MLRKTTQEFLIYSFLGWMLENCFNKAVAGKFLKPNFLHGPVKPMYGFGGVLLVQSYRYTPRQFAWTSVLIPLAVEWCSGKWLNDRFHLKYWDYSSEKIQLGGYICLRFALCWAVLAQVVVHIVQPILDKGLYFIGKLPIWNTLFRSFFLDCAWTLYQREKAV